MASGEKQRAGTLVRAALELPPEERTRFLREACGGDPRLWSEVEALLAGGDTTSLPTAAEDLPETTALPGRETGAGALGRTIGPYRLVGVLGHGGMGSVWLAERVDEQYEKRVAVKLVRASPDSSLVLDRFLEERQILATLEHPNIARLLDGGTTSEGRPYLVMEHVEGVSIDAYCDARRLSTAERLLLFRTVCSAVQHAHRNLVVHRDLKPANVLVTAEGVPKLLDFGIAKLLDPEGTSRPSPWTLDGLRAMTPQYASPEQIRGDPVTTAADVYSLGVVLYELLTGHLPHRLKSRPSHEVAHAVCEEEPERPSTAIGWTEEIRASDGSDHASLAPTGVSATRDGTPEKLRRRLRGDLDAIVLMALRKEPRKRYASVEQLSEDVRRHMEGLPVLARKGTLAYRTGKFVRRNRLAILAATALALSLVGGILATHRQARIAERRFEQVRRLASALMYDLHDEIGTLPGSTRAREKLVRMALEYLDNLSREAEGDRALLAELAEAYRRVGDIQGNPYSANLGDSVGALASYRKAVSIDEVLIAANPSDTKLRYEVARGHALVGGVLAETGRTAEALESQRKALALFEALVDPNGPIGPALRELGVAYERLGNMLQETGDLEGALAYHQRSLGIAERLVEADPKDVQARQDASISHLKIANLLGELGHATEALASLRPAIAIHEALASEDPSNARIRRELALFNELLGTFLAEEGRFLDALEHQRKAIEVLAGLLDSDPNDALVRSDLAEGHWMLGDTLALSGDLSGALESYRQARGFGETLNTLNPANVWLARILVAIDEKTARTLARMGDRAGAAERFQKAIESGEKLAAEDPANRTFRLELAAFHHHYAELHESGENGAGALAERQRAQAILDSLATEGPVHEGLRRALALSALALCRSHAALASSGDAPESSRSHREAARSSLEKALRFLEEEGGSQVHSRPSGAAAREIAEQRAKCEAALAGAGG